MERTGWGIPMATDIAFALAVLAIMGRGLPLALRAFLLTLAVVDDLGAITVIAIFYSDGFQLAYFVASVALVALWWFLQHRRFNGRRAALAVYLPLALLIWYTTHESGIHATVAGVAMGLATRVSHDPGEDQSPGDRAEHALRPFVAGFAVPLFAFTSAGVTVRDVGDSAAPVESFGDDPHLSRGPRGPRGAARRQADRRDRRGLVDGPLHPRLAEPRPALGRRDCRRGPGRASGSRSAC